MKKFLIVVSAFCLCLSLFAAEGEAEAEAKKDQKPYWTSKNLLYGPGLTFIGLLGITPLGLYVCAAGASYHVFWAWPLVTSSLIFDGVTQTATFGLLYNNRTEEDYIWNYIPGLGKSWEKKKEGKPKPKVEDAWQ